MMNRTDFNMICELVEEYKPAQRGIVSADEQKLIREKLMLSARSDIEVQNVRDMSVMYLNIRADNAQQNGDHEKCMQYMDMCSAIVCVIDHEKWNRGMNV